MRYTVIPITSEGNISEAYAVHCELDTTKPKITKLLSEVNDARRQGEVHLIMQFNNVIEFLEIINETITDIFSGVKYPYSYLETMIQLLIDQDNL